MGKILDLFFYFIMMIGCFYISYLSFLALRSNSDGLSLIERMDRDKNKNKYPPIISFKGFDFKRTFGNGYTCDKNTPTNIKLEASIEYDIDIIK